MQANDISGLISNLTSLGLDSAQPVVEHSAVETVAEWEVALNGASNVPSQYTLTKTLIFKPKQPKSAPVAPVMVVAKATTGTNTTVLGKELGLKDMRFANDKVLSEVFSTEKGSVSPFALAQVPEESIGHVKVVLDAALVGESGPIAFHPLDSSRTVFVSSATLVSFLGSVGGLEPFVSVDFDKLAAAAPPAAAAAAGNGGKAKGGTKAKAAVQKAKVEEPAGAAKLGIEASKTGDFAKWYQQVVTRSEMLDYYDVSGCYILRPLSYFIWQQIQDFFDSSIRSMGVKNCYFPMFVSSRVLEREKDHIEGFAPEVAWVTKAGSSELAEHLAIRPTSETVIYPYFAKWIRSHRDLPLKINQWCSVVRWEFKNPQPFLRTREFLWQEGHCAHLTKGEAMVEVRDILTLYRRVYEELLAVPVIEGVKSEKEKFAGGVSTCTVEGFIPTTGRGIQGGTSHYLGQNFSRMFNVVVEDPESTAADRPKIHVHQTSWGLSTRTIGVMVMVHGDDKGLVLPPRVAETQVIVIPCGLTVKHTDDDRARVAAVCRDVEDRLRKAGIRAESDLRFNYTPGFKYSHWELRGVPLRLEIGPKDLEKKSALSVRRDTFGKAPLQLDQIEESVSQMLEAIQGDMLERARKMFSERVRTVEEWSEFVPTLDSKCLALVPWCERTECEEAIKDKSSRAALEEGEAEDEKAPSMGAKSLCIPYQQPEDGKRLVPGVTKCIQCGEDAKSYTLFGRSY